MSILADFPTGLAYKRLERQRRRQSVIHHSVAFTETESIAILFQAYTLEDVTEVKDFAAYLKEQGKKVTVLGYTSATNETRFKTKSVFFEYFTEKDLSFLFIPSSAKHAEFLEQCFDLLIDRKSVV